MKILNIIKKIFIGILAVAFFTFAIVMTVLLLYRNDFGVTQFDNTSLIIVKDDVTSNHFKKGDLVVVEKRKVEKINVGDEAFAYKINKDNSVTVEFGVVGETHVDDDSIKFENGGTYSSEYVAGVTTDVHPGLGKILGVILSRWGFLLMILVPSFLIFIYELYALIVEIKYGTDEQ